MLSLQANGIRDKGLTVLCKALRKCDFVSGLDLGSANGWKANVLGETDRVWM
jgi:hypothetical protein